VRPLGRPGFIGLPPLHAGELVDKPCALAINAIAPKASAQYFVRLPRNDQSSRLSVDCLIA
jgi:hypothetical protein